MSLKTCLTCPSSLTASEAQDFFGDASIKVAMCSLYGYVLAEPKAGQMVEADQDVAIQYATKCSSYGKPRPSGPTSQFKPQLFRPDASLLDKQPSDRSVQSCIDCKNCFTSVDHGVQGCDAKGLVVFNSKRIPFAVDGASGCAWREKRDLSGFPLERRKSPSLHPVFIKAPVKKPSKAATATFSTIDPTDAESDRLVSDADKAVGIRAWRNIPLGNKGEETAYPIFSTAFFDDESRALIPRKTDEDGDPSLYIDHAGLMSRFISIGYKLDKVTCLVGEPGSGKSTGVRFIAYSMNMPFIAINYDEATDPIAILGMQGVEVEHTRDEKGKVVSSNSVTRLQAGVLPKWIEKPCVLLSDELNVAEDSIKQAYRSLFDTGKNLLVHGHNYRRNDYCFPFVAMNPSWDFRNVGAKEMASADIRRMSYFYMPMPDRDMQAKIIRATVLKVNGKELPNSVIDVIIKISTSLQEMAKQGQIPHHWTLAQDIKVAQFFLHWSLEEAYNMSYFYYIDPDVAKVAMSNIKTMIPVGV